MKRIAVVLVFLLLIQAIPLNFFNYAESIITINKMIDMSESELDSLTDSQIFNAITSSSNYDKDTVGRLSYDGKTERIVVNLNIESFRKYRQIIYGKPFTNESNYNGKVIDSEPKYLGFNRLGLPMTNDKYPGVNLKTEPPDKKWIAKVNQYSDTWTTFKNSSDDINELYNHILKTDTINSDAVGRYSLEEILRKTDGMSNLSSYIGSDNDTLRDKLGSVAKLQSIPTFFSQGSFVMKHNYGGTVYYDTMEWQRIKSFNGSLSIEPEFDRIIMLPDQNEVTNNFTVTLNYNDRVSGGMETELLLPKFIDLKLSTDSHNDEVQSVEKGNPTYTFSKTYYRNKLGSKGIKKKKVVADTAFDTLVGDEFGFSSSAEFEIDVKMVGNINVDFLIESGGNDYTDDSIVLKDGEWQSPSDSVSVYLKDLTELSDSLLNDIPTASVVSWNWYAKNKLGEYVLIGDPVVNKEMNYDIKLESDFSFNTPTDKGIKTVVEFKLEVMDSEGNKGEVLHNVTISESPPPTPTPDPTPNEPPKARIKIKEEIKAGAKSKATSRSTDEDGSIVAYDWDIWNAYYYKGRHDKRTYFYILDVNDSARAELEVTDDDGASDDTWTRFAIVNPLTPVIETYGALKENRKVNISSGMSRGTKYFPIQWDRTEWKITPLDGQSSESIKFDGELLGKDKDVLFKEPGQYKVWMKLYTTCTYKDEEDITYDAEIEKIITIKPDEKPIADLSLRKMVYRNPDTDGVAVLNMADNSSSIDGDFIAHRKWSYTFDSDNDGSFDDEVAKVASDENEVMVQINVDKVGNYLITLEVTEEFGQPTIEKFVTVSDRRKDDNTDIEEEKRTSEVLNVAPTVELNFDERKQVDLILLTDYEGQALMDLRDQVDSLKMRLQEQKVDAEIHIFDNNLDENYQDIGRLNDPTYLFSKKAILSYVWKEIKHYDDHDYTHSDYNVRITEDSMVIESLSCKMSEISNHMENKGYYGEIIDDGDWKSTSRDYNKYFINVYDKSNTKKKTFEHDMVTYEGGRRFQDTFFEPKVTTDIDNMDLIIQNKFYPSKELNDNWEKYHALKVDKIKDIPLRDNSDRYLIMATKKRDSLGMLDDSFYDYVVENNIITRASLDEMYREFYARYYDFNDIQIEEKAVYVKTPFGSKLKIGDSLGASSYLDFTYESVDFEGDKKKQMKVVRSLSNIPTYSGKASYGKTLSEDTVFKDGYGRLYYSGGKIIFSYGFPEGIFEVKNDTENYLRKTDTIASNVVDVYMLKDEVFIYKTSDGKWHYGKIKNDSADSYFYEASNRWKADYFVYNLYKGVLKVDLDIDKIKSISQTHVLGENGKLYYFSHPMNRTYYLSDEKDCKLIAEDVERAYNMNDRVIYTRKDEPQSLKEAGNYLADGFYGIHKRDIYIDKKVDEIRSAYGTTVILFEDNTIVGAGQSLYCQLGKKQEDKDKPLSYQQLYESPVELSNEYKDKDYVCPMEIVSSGVLNKAYRTNENSKLIEDIYNTYKKEDTDNAVILLGTKANMKTFYSDYEDDPLYDYRWDVVHDETYYENDLGKDPRAKLNGEPIEVFDYTGHYKIDLKVQDNPVADDDRFDNYRLWNKDETTLNVYVHRKPRVRDGLYAKKTDGKLHVYAADEGSYDLDHLSQSNKGIRSHDWYWRTDRNRIWINEKLDLRDAEYNTTYYISHRVKDEEGVWSDFSSREIVIGEDIPVVITANIDAYLNSKFDINKIPVDEKISVKDIKVTYYADVNLTATLEKNASVIKELLNKDSNTSGVSKDDTGFIYEDIVEKLPHNLDDGDYSVRLVARDLSDSSKSASVNLPFKINTPIDLRAVLPDQAVVGEKAKISCSTSKYTDSVELIAFNDDNDIKTKYNMKLDKETGDRKIWTADVEIPWSCKDRNYDFKFIGTVETDTPKREELIKDMRIVVLEIAEIGIKGYWNHWRGQENMFGERMTVEPHRFLSHETVIIYGYIAGNPDKVYVEFSPQLEAMFFTDPAGNEYSYEEDIGYTVDFPLEMPLEKYRYYEVEYQLPIAWTTIDWDNNRVRNSYWMKITAEKSGVKVSEQFDDIEITGTVYDLLYVQPYHKPEK